MAVTWTLTEIQEESFSMTFDLYRPASTTKVTGFKRFKGHELVAEAVPGRIQTKSEAGDVLGLLRVNLDQMDTTDIIRLPEIYDEDEEPLNIGDRWAAKIKTGAGSENGSWVGFAGEGINRAYRANTRIYLVRKNIEPIVTVTP